MSDIKLTYRDSKNEVKSVMVKDSDIFNQIYYSFSHGGRANDTTDNDSILQLRDMITAEDLAPFVTKVVKKIIVNSIEPQLLIIPNLFTRIDAPTGQNIEISALGAITAGLVAPNGDYPTTQFAMDTVGGTTAIHVSKYGCQLNIAQDAVQESQFDVITLWLQAAGSALARLKESLGIRLINEMGTTVFDNAEDGDVTPLGLTTGRGIDGAANATMTMNDIFDMWIYLAVRGFVPDTLVMNPLAWRMFAGDAELREIVLKGAVLSTRRMPLGSPAIGFADPFGGYGLKMTGTGDETGSSAWTQNLTAVGASWNVPPSVNLPSPLKVIVSHLVPFTERASGLKPLTNIIMADSQSCGILVEKTKPTTEEADVFQNSSHIVRVYEKYGMDVWNQGKGITIAKNIVVDKNYVFDNTNARALAALGNSALI